jgi:hypothetical protein
MKRLTAAPLHGFVMRLNEVDMIFEHAETGIRVVVHETVEKIKYEMSDGTGGYVDGKKELTTESGQQCIPASIDDVHDLRLIDVWTVKGKVRLVRVD